MKHFKPYELVCPKVYELLGDESELLIDYKLRLTMDALKEFVLAKYGKCAIYINSWFWGGQFSERGFRLKGSIGSKNSMHKKGRAIDSHCSACSPEDLREIILRNPSIFPHVTRMEGKVNWLHIDIKPTGKNEVIVFNP